MVEKCPHCGAPYKYSEEINNLIEKEIVTCEYCQSQFVIEPKMKKTAAAVSITKEIFRDKRTEEQKRADEKKTKQMLLLVAFIMILSLIGVVYAIATN